jgi:hypothetical protein
MLMKAVRRKTKEKGMRTLGFGVSAAARKPQTPLQCGQTVQPMARM